MVSTMKAGIVFVLGTLALGLCLIVAAWFTPLGVARPDNADHVCYAPCKVVLPDNTQEDEFWFDYGWVDDDTSALWVYGCRGVRSIVCDRRAD
jgi:hypothetical protein